MGGASGVVLHFSTSKFADENLEKKFCGLFGPLQDPQLLVAVRQNASFRPSSKVTCPGFFLPFSKPTFNTTPLVRPSVAGFCVFVPFCKVRTTRRLFVSKLFDPRVAALKRSFLRTNSCLQSKKGIFSSDENLWSAGRAFRTDLSQGLFAKNRPETGSGCPFLVAGPAGTVFLGFRDNS